MNCTEVKKKDTFSYSYGWRTAPESYKFYLNGKRINLPSATESDLGYKVICGKVKEAEDELKRMIRKERKREKLVTFGFMEKDSNIHYLYPCAIWLCCNQYNIVEKLKAYKTIKDDWIKKGCKELAATTATLEAGFRVGEVTENYTYIDINRPKRVYIKIA